MMRLLRQDHSTMPSMKDAAERSRSGLSVDAYDRARGFVRLLVRIFFKQVQCSGTEDLPADRGALLVAWHPNGLVDPALILSRCPDPVRFGARIGLFRYPLLGRLLRLLGCVPIFRRQDPGADDAARKTGNEQSLDALARALAQGGFTALFPEGYSHDDPHLAELRTGVARLYYRARMLRGENPPPAIVLVGLHYDRKRSYRSRALVAFHSPLVLPPDLDVDSDPDRDPEGHTQRVEALTAILDESLQRVVMATESWELHSLMHRARKLVRAERAHRAHKDPGEVPIEEAVLGMERIWVGYQKRIVSHPAATEDLLGDMRDYHADLRALGLDDHQLDKDPSLLSPWLPVLFGLQIVTVFLLMPPLLLVGYVVNWPVALLLAALTKALGRTRKDEATLKILLGLVLFPLTWGALAILAAWGQLAVVKAFPGVPENPWLAATATVLLCVLGGALSVRYARLARETLRSMRIRLTRRRRWYSVARLRKNRGILFERILVFAAGIDLPGEVLEDGRIV